MHNVPHITDRIVKEETAKIKRYNEMIKNMESNMDDMRSTLKSEIQRLTGDVAPVKEKFEKGLHNFIEERLNNKTKRKFAESKKDGSPEKFCRTLDAKDQDKL